MYIWLILALSFVLLEAVAVARNQRGLEYTAKPGVMIWLFLWLYAGTGLRGNALWFGLGIFFSLLGDILLLFPLDRLFLAGLVAFLCAHLAYIAGFSDSLSTFQVGSLMLAIFIVTAAGSFLRRTVTALRSGGANKLALPVLVYGMVASTMLFASMSTLLDPAWRARAAIFVSLGAFLFCASDALLAWNKFVAAIRNGRIMSMLLYHLGQIGIIAGVVSQFG